MRTKTSSEVILIMFLASMIGVAFLTPATTAARNPPTINLKSKGSLITAYIETPGWHLLFRDSFSAESGNKSDYYPDDPWNPIHGTWSIDSGEMLQSDWQANDLNVAVYGDETMWTDYILETTITPINGSGQLAPYGYAGIIFRVNQSGIWGSGTFYYWLIGVTDTGAPGYSTLWHSPSQSVLWGSGLTGIPAGNTLIKGRPNLVRIEVAGSHPVSINLYLRNNLEASVVVSNPAKEIYSGAIGLATYASSTSFDNVVATSQVHEVNLSTVMLYIGADGVAAETNPKYSFVTDMYSYSADVDEDGTLERTVKFNKTTVIDHLEPYIGEKVTLTISGSFLDGTLFAQDYTVRVIKPPKK